MPTFPPQTGMPPMSSTGSFASIARGAPIGTLVPSARPESKPMHEQTAMAYVLDAGNGRLRVGHELPSFKERVDGCACACRWSGRQRRPSSSGQCTPVRGRTWNGVADGGGNGVIGKSTGSPASGDRP